MQNRIKYFVMKRAVLCIVLLQPLVANADLLNHNFSVTYEVSRNGIYIGDTVRKFQQTPNGHWQYTSTTTAKGIAAMFISDVVRETSTLIQKGNSIMPLTYRYDQSGGKEQRHYQIDFLWDKQTIHTTDKNKDFKLEHNAQDIQTFQLQIMRDMQLHKNTMAYFIANNDEASSYTLTRNGHMKIETPLKSLETIELVSNKIKENDQYRVWCAPSFEFMPVRFQKTDSKGNKIEFSIKDFRLE